MHTWELAVTNIACVRSIIEKASLIGLTFYTWQMCLVLSGDSYHGKFSLLCSAIDLKPLSDEWFNKPVVCHCVWRFYFLPLQAVFNQGEFKDLLNHLYCTANRSVLYKEPLYTKLNTSTRESNIKMLIIIILPWQRGKKSWSLSFRSFAELLTSMRHGLSSRKHYWRYVNKRKRQGVIF